MTDINKYGADTQRNNEISCVGPRKYGKTISRSKGQSHGENQPFFTWVPFIFQNQATYKLIQSLEKIICILYKLLGPEISWAESQLCSFRRKKSNKISVVR